MKIDMLSKTMSYFSEYKSCCFHNCIRQIFEYYGIENAQLLINTDYTFGAQREDDIGPKLHLTRESQQYLQGRYEDKIHISDLSQMTLDELIDNNNKRIKAGIPSIISVDVYYLFYDNNYGVSNSTHSIIYCGCSEKGDPIVFDYGERIQYSGFIPLNEYKLARSSENFKNRNIYSGHPINGNEAWIDQIGSECLDYYHLSKNILNKINSYYQYQYRGINAVEEISRFFSDIIRYGNYENVAFFDLYYILYNVNRKRKLCALSLLKIADEFSLNEIVSFEAKMRECSQLWDSFIITLAKGIYSNNKKRILENLIKKITAIYHYELQLYDLLVLSISCL